MSRVLPPSPTRAELRPRPDVSGTAVVREAAVSWDPLRGTDRYRYALVYDDRSRTIVPAAPSAAD
jgi:hypothetical protein